MGYFHAFDPYCPRERIPCCTQWSQLCITFANWGQLARNLSHQFIIGVAYCDDKDATILANLWETNIKVCVTMRPSWLITSDCSIYELNFQLVQLNIQLNITTYHAPSSVSSCCKLSLTVQHLSGSGRSSIAKSGSGVRSRGCGHGWDYRNIGRSLVYMHLPFGKGPNDANWRTNAAEATYRTGGGPCMQRCGCMRPPPIRLDRWRFVQSILNGLMAIGRLICTYIEDSVENYHDSKGIAINKTCRVRWSLGKTSKPTGECTWRLMLMWYCMHVNG